MKMYLSSFRLGDHPEQLVSLVGTNKKAAIIANYAAGIVVGKIGTSSVSIEELKGSIENE